MAVRIITATLALLAAALACHAAAQPFELTPLGLTNDSLPPSSPPDGSILGIGVNSSGQLGFGATFGDRDENGYYEAYAVYRRSGTTTELLAFTGDPLPDGSGQTFDLVSLVAIEASGDVIFEGESCDGVPLGSADCIHGIYRATGSGLTTIVQSPAAARSRSPPRGSRASSSPCIAGAKGC